MLFSFEEDLHVEAKTAEPKMEEEEAVDVEDVRIERMGVPGLGLSRHQTGDGMWLP